jgi:hypothetical protein
LDWSPESHLTFISFLLSIVVSLDASARDTQSAQSSENSANNNADEEAQEESGADTTTTDADSNTPDDNADNTTKAVDSDNEAEDLASSVSKMTLTEAVSTMKIPVLMYEYSDEDGFSYVTADVLMLSDACTKDVSVKIDSTGSYITVTHKIPETFLAWQRIEIEDTERNKQSPWTKSASLTQAATALRKKALHGEDGRPIMEFKFKLPIPCKTIFAQKPFIASYPNDYRDQRNSNHQNNYKILHIDLDGLHVP